MTSPRTDLKHLSASQMFDAAYVQLIHSQKYSMDKITGESKAEDYEFVYGAKFANDHQTLVLLNPACDADTNQTDQNLGKVVDLATSLKKISSMQQANSGQIYVIPLLEVQSITGFTGARNHWTVLVIQNDVCYFIDPSSASYWSGSSSSVYTLRYLTQILDNNNIKLDKQIFLGLQNNYETSGHYCSAIIGAIAVELMEHGKFENIEEYLKRARLDIEDYKEILSARWLRDTNWINRLRGQLYTRDELSVSDLESEEKTENIALDDARNKKFFVAGSVNENLRQFKLDFGRKLLKLNGKSFDDFKIEFSNKNIDDATLEEFANFAKLLKRDMQIIINAHSQETFAFIPFVLSKGIKFEGDDALPDYTIKQPNASDFESNVIADNKTTKLICKYQKLPMLNSLGSGQEGFIDGPITTTFELKQKNNCWGWQLISVETHNNDVKRILLGERIAIDYFTTHVLSIPQAKKVNPPIGYEITHHKTTPEFKYQQIVKIHADLMAGMESFGNAMSSRLAGLEKRAANLQEKVVFIKQAAVEVGEIKGDSQHNAEEVRQKIIEISRLKSSLLEAKSEAAANSAWVTLLEKQLKERENLFNAKTVLVQQLTASYDTRIAEMNSEKTNLSTALQQIQQNPLLQPETHKQPVYPYVGATIIATGVATVSGLIELGVLNIALLAAIPMAGWAMATGFFLALAGMMLVKSINNVVTNHRFSINPAAQEGLHRYGLNAATSATAPVEEKQVLILESEQNQAKPV